MCRVDCYCVMTPCLTIARCATECVCMTSRRKSDATAQTSGPRSVTRANSERSMAARLKFKFCYGLSTGSSPCCFLLSIPANLKKIIVLRSRVFLPSLVCNARHQRLSAFTCSCPFAPSTIDCCNFQQHLKTSPQNEHNLTETSTHPTTVALHPTRRVFTNAFLATYTTQ